MTKLLIFLLFICTHVMYSQTMVTTLADSTNVFLAVGDPGYEADSQVCVRSKARYTVPWKVYYDTGKKKLAYESFLDGDTCTSFNYWRANGQLKKKSKFLKDTTFIHPVYGAAFHWYYEETYCLNGQQTYKGYPNHNSSQYVVTYHCNGKKKMEYTSNADNSAPEGLLTMWYDNGQKREECYYKNGQRDGTWLKWTREGKPGETTRYVDGQEALKAGKGGTQK